MRDVGLLQRLLTPTFHTSSLEACEADWLEWGQAVSRYGSLAQPGSEVAEHMQVAVVLARAPDRIKV